jgi:hypothetical protein
MPPDPGNHNGRTHRCITCPRDAHLHETPGEIEERQDHRRWAFSLLEPADRDRVVRREASRQYYGRRGLHLVDGLTSGPQP